MNNKPWYEVKENLPYIDITIGNDLGSNGYSARQFLNEMKPHGGKPFRFFINSNGGVIVDAFAVYDFVRLQGYHVSAYINGTCASAAVVCALAAKEVFIGEHSHILIHNPSLPNGKGNLADLYKVRRDIIDIYHRKTGLDKERIGKMMDSETRLDAEQALDLGFVDGITREVIPTSEIPKPTHSPIRKGWRYVSEYLLNRKR